MPEHGPVLGKGDAMWRALAAVTGDVVAYIDADTRDFDARFVNGLVGPLLTDPALRFVKATYRRPFTAGGLELPGRRRAGQPAHGAPAAGRVLPRAGGADPAAGRRGGRHARAAGVDPVRHRLRRGDGDAAGRARRRRAPARWPSATWASGATTTSRWTPCGRWPRRCWPWCAEHQGLDTAGPEIVRRPPFAPMSLRCVYTDLDGTLLGAGASLFRDGEGEFTLLPARALEACHRAGRRGGAQVGAAQGPGHGGRAPDRPGAPTSTRSAPAWSSTARSSCCAASSRPATARPRTS